MAIILVRPYFRTGGGPDRSVRLLAFYTEAGFPAASQAYLVLMIKPDGDRPAVGTLNGRTFLADLDSGTRVADTAVCPFATQRIASSFSGVRRSECPWSLPIRLPLCWSLHVASSSMVDIQSLEFRTD